MAVPDPLSLGQGQTPVLALPSLARHCAVPELWVKAEWCNPTGSYKDRIAVETMRDAVRRGAHGWLGTSSGNGGASMSAYGSRAGLQGFLCVAADAPTEKLQAIVPYGATVLPMANLGLEVMDEIRAIADEHALKLAITAYRYNPEGMCGAESIGAELVDQGSFTHVYVPTGGGGLLAAVARGVDSAADSGPVVVCAQPRGCAPIARFLAGEIDAPEVAEWATTISGLQLPTPPDGDLAATAARTSGGWGCLVSDEEAWEMQSLLARYEGIFVEPASAVAVAAIVRDCRLGRLTDAARPIAVLTGTGLKDLRRFAAENGVLRTLHTVEDLRALLARRST